MKIVADLHLHSKYSRAVSSQMNILNIGTWADKKGINLVGTGDFNHPMWFRELKASLEEESEGIFKLKNSTNKSRFLLTNEISCIYKDKGKVRRIHVLVCLPSFQKVEEFSKQLINRGFNIFSDGRPILGLSIKALADLLLTEIDPNTLIIPAHAWTPWFGIFGSFGGYDSLEDAFEDLAKYIPAVETGLSSDPAMNWRIGELTNRQIVSFGDAHSFQKLGREATVFNIENLSYENTKKAISNPDTNNKIDYTIEFYPEEGKYHYTGHAKCKVVYSPNEARKKGLICPVCSKPLTSGVMSRVEQLASSDIETESKINKNGLRWIIDKAKKRKPYIMLVPLLEILSEVEKGGVGSKKVLEKYDFLINSLGSEFDILINTSLNDIEKIGGTRLKEAITRVRSGDIAIEPGYDGIFGKVKIWKEEPQNKEAIDQTTLF